MTNFSSVIIDNDDQKELKEKSPTTEEFLEALNRTDMLNFFKSVDSMSYNKSIRLARKLINKFVKEDPKLNLLRAFFILFLFNTEEYRFYREAYNYAVKVAPSGTVKLADVYHASLILSRDPNYKERIESMSPFLRRVVDRLVTDVKAVRSELKERQKKGSVLN